MSDYDLVFVDRRRPWHCSGIQCAPCSVFLRLTCVCPSSGTCPTGSACACPGSVTRMRTLPTNCTPWSRTSQSPHAKVSPGNLEHCVVFNHTSAWCRAWLNFDHDFYFFGGQTISKLIKSRWKFCFCFMHHVFKIKNICLNNRVYDFKKRTLWSSPCMILERSSPKAVWAVFSFLF